ncbi:MAG TPA: hypothetical protein VIF09_06885 [Polyangiaceae bacterium]
MIARLAPLASFVALGAAIAWGVRVQPPPRPATTADGDPDEEVDLPGFKMDLGAPRSSVPMYRGFPSDLAPEPALAPDAPALESLPIARPDSPPPGDREFETAREVSLAGNKLAAANIEDTNDRCTARERRGWLRVVCPAFGPSVSVLGGSVAGVAVKLETNQATITMPLARGDVRVLQLARIGSAYWDGKGLVAVGILSESWVGTVGPHVAIYRPPEVFGMR